MLFFCFIAATESYGQLFPGLAGEELVNAIRDEYTPSQLLNDTQVKDTLYARVFLQDDSVRCIYSGLSRFLPSGQDPSQWLYGSGLETGSINLEHGWPQAKGAGEGTDGNTNMYHLFPSRTAINSDRGDLPFGNIPDQQTTRWYFKDKEMASIPGISIDAYSEYKVGSFEPREAVKGDIARGMFYFWTIYRQDAISADPFFFDVQAENLCLWHSQDPADQDEILRNNIISDYQGGKKNPFIIDCSLAMRAYCEELPECMMVSSAFIENGNYRLTYLHADQQFAVKGDGLYRWHLAVVDVAGRQVASAELETNANSEPIAIPSGFYFVFATCAEQVLSLKVFIP